MPRRSRARARRRWRRRATCCSARFAQLARHGLRGLPLRHGWPELTAPRSIHTTGASSTPRPKPRLQRPSRSQTVWHSIRPGLPCRRCPTSNLDRIGVTGASGGGTQTLYPARHRRSTDRRLPGRDGVHEDAGRLAASARTASFYLRQDTGNIELAALFALEAPRHVSGATTGPLDIEKKGCPELKGPVPASTGSEEPTFMCEVLPAVRPQLQPGQARELMYKLVQQALAWDQAGGAGGRKNRSSPGAASGAVGVYDEQHLRPKFHCCRCGFRLCAPQLPPDRGPAPLEVISTAAAAEGQRGVWGGGYRRVLGHACPARAGQRPATFRRRGRGREGWATKEKQDGLPGAAAAIGPQGNRARRCRPSASAATVRRHRW